jgi:hypothetical protein
MRSFARQLMQEEADEQAFRDYFRDQVIGTFDEDNRDVIAGLILGELTDDRKKRLAAFADSSRDHMLGAQLMIARYADQRTKTWKFCVAQLKNRIDGFYENDPKTATIFTECVTGYLSFFGKEAAQEITEHANAWEQTVGIFAHIRKG